MTSSSVEAPSFTTAGNSRFIGEVPVTQGLLAKGISVRFSTTRSIVSHTAQGITTFTNVIQGQDTVVLVYFTFEGEPDTTCVSGKEEICVHR